MSAVVIDGKKIAGEIRDEVMREVRAFREKGVSPKMAVVLIGDDPASVVYARAKEKACEKVQIDYELVRFPASASETQVIEKIRELSADSSVHGIMVELPLPAHISKERVTLEVAPLKDVDCVNPQNRGFLFSRKEGLFPATPTSCVEIVKRSGLSLEGKHVVLVGRGDTVGKPLIFLLLQENATVTVCHTRTRDLAYHTKQADVLIAAAGKAGLISGDMIKPGAWVVDAGINEVEGGVTGDVRFQEALGVAGYITPVPGGVGALTTVLILKNLIKALRMQRGEA